MPPSGFSFAVENNIGGLIQIEGLIKLTARYPTDKIGITLDIGHAHIGGKVVDAIRVAAPRLLSVHAHDNDGAKDDHMVPGQGTAPWDDLKKALHAVNFNGPLVWEIRDPTAGNDPGLKVKSKILEETKRFDATFTRS
jgi:sugar phosphate isomerase/epimerase